MLGVPRVVVVRCWGSPEEGRGCERLPGVHGVRGEGLLEVIRIKRVIRKCCPRDVVRQCGGFQNKIISWPLGWQSVTFCMQVLVSSLPAVA